MTKVSDVTNKKNWQERLKVYSIPREGRGGDTSMCNNTKEWSQGVALKKDVDNKQMITIPQRLEELFEQHS